MIETKGGGGLRTFVSAGVPIREIKTCKFPSEIAIIVLKLINKSDGYFLISIVHQTKAQSFS